MDILDITVNLGDNSPLVCMQKSVRDAELQMIEDYRQTMLILFQLVLTLSGESRD